MGKLTNQIIWTKKNAILGNLGVTHYYNQNLGLDFRATLAKNPSYWAWTLSLRAIYTLNGQVL